MKNFLEQQLWLADWYFFITVLKNKKIPFAYGPWSKNNRERGWGVRDDPSNASNAGDSDVVGDSGDVGDGIDAGDGGGQKGMQGGCQVGDSGTPEPPWSLSHPPKLIIIAVCDINIRLLIPFWFLPMFSKSCFIQALFNLTK